ncbi:DUF86 domain-containing protein [Faecalicatena contorta]|uniref:HepT-like ribonuclease domain-containing protein n=1 Tax=Faecalicatena contorta TaxID=39482 RepID=UPI001F486F9A|nr:HepT-like ribonuclease domain-containing protein [Faecalicatena contorta]MCF2555774.1 DUF86 domain-containing protein [Faecalicatena contorta]MCF2679223.1 DUF86 domain-containing protein [Faecalicatena contorta]
MDNIKNNAYYIQKIRKDLEFIVTQMRDVDIEELNTNEVLLDSMLFRMIQISENAKKLSDEYKMSHRYVPWNALSGMRNRIVHDYGNVDLNVVYETLKTDIPELIELLED